MGLVTTSPGSGIIISAPQRVERDDERIFDFSFKCKTCHVCFFIVGFPIWPFKLPGKGSGIVMIAIIDHRHILGFLADV
jgi:hypothetical protein